MNKILLHQRPPKTRRSFNGKWDEVFYLCQKTNYYLHIKRQRYRAGNFALRLQILLSGIQDISEAIIGETSKALICEYNKNWSDGVLHREKEIKLILQLYRSFLPTQDPETIRFLLKGWRKEDVLLRLKYIINTYEAYAGHPDLLKIEKLIDVIRSVSPHPY